MASDMPQPLTVDVPPSPEDPPVDFGNGKPRPYALVLRLAIGSWVVHFKSRTEKSYLKEDTMDMLDRTVVRKTVERTRVNAAAREEIGTYAPVWHDMGELVIASIPSLERRCFKDPPPPEDDPDAHEPVSGMQIADNYSSLMKDLSRLNSMVAITRNVLTVGEKAQSLASKTKFDKAIFELINVCIKITARGFDGDPGTQEEEKWQAVINEFKKVLITSLQFLNNLVTGNERRKLMLWIQLFDNNAASDPVVDAYQTERNSPSVLDPANDNHGAFQGTLIDSVAQHIVAPDEIKLPVGFDEQARASSPFLLFIGKTGMDVKRQLQEQGRDAEAKDIAAECQHRWLSMDEDTKAQWDDFYREVAKQSAAQLGLDMIQAGGASIDLALQLARMTESHIVNAGHSQDSIDQLERSIQQLQVDAEMLAATSAVPTSVSRLQGADMLQRGKDELMKRLEPTVTPVPRPAMKTSAASPTMHDEATPPMEPIQPAEVIEESADEEESDDDDDYVVPGDDGRGLLTDVPLILGPTEIEVLPLIIMSGVVPREHDGPYEETDSTIAASTLGNSHAVRCHLLLSQDNGRNLLRELLIFVAAWDLREEELYFKFMVRIMQAILANGLMPFSYHAFRETKDIISPAQAVIMKLLTNIFRARQEEEKAYAKKTGLPDMTFPSVNEVQMVKFLFTEFRQRIVPQSGTLIYLQGRIRQGHASPDEFPLNLWDMERMYEGIYQYLEFFAILTEHDTWKEMMTEWDMANELVSLLKELDLAIPKVNLPTLPSVKMSATAEQIKRSTEAATAITYDGPAAGSARNDRQQAQPDPGAAGTGANGEAYKSAQNPMPPAHFITEVGGGFGNESPADEPSDFEWRNLKKLAVLVLSSLVWKSRTAQDQVRSHGGIPALVGCCQNDEHNPYIREHAIMALRFLIEDNQANRQEVQSLNDPRGTVPGDVWDSHIYEQFIDNRGQIGLRRKNIMSSANHAPLLKADGMSLLSNYDHKVLTRDTRDLADMMQSMMKELPARVQSARLEAEKAAVAKLDRGFEGSG